MEVPSHTAFRWEKPKSVLSGPRHSHVVWQIGLADSKSRRMIHISPASLPAKRMTTLQDKSPASTPVWMWQGPQKPKSGQLNACVTSRRVRIQKMDELRNSGLSVVSRGLERPRLSRPNRMVVQGDDDANRDIILLARFWLKPQTIAVRATFRYQWLDFGCIWM